MKTSLLISVFIFSFLIIKVKAQTEEEIEKGKVVETKKNVQDKTIIQTTDEKENKKTEETTRNTQDKTTPSTNNEVDRLKKELDELKKQKEIVRLKKKIEAEKQSIKSLEHSTNNEEKKQTIDQNKEIPKTNKDQEFFTKNNNDSLIPPSTNNYQHSYLPILETGLKATIAYPFNAKLIIKSTADKAKTKLEKNMTFGLDYFFNKDTTRFKSSLLGIGTQYSKLEGEDSADDYSSFFTFLSSRFLLENKIVFFSRVGIFFFGPSSIKKINDNVSKLYKTFGFHNVSLKTKQSPGLGISLGLSYGLGDRLSLGLSYNMYNLTTKVNGDAYYDDQYRFKVTTIKTKWKVEKTLLELIFSF